MINNFSFISKGKAEYKLGKAVCKVLYFFIKHFVYMLRSNWRNGRMCNLKSTSTGGIAYC